MKFISSPIPPVVVKNTLTIFFTRHTKTPASGLMVKAAIKAGSSDRSSFKKLGTSGIEMLKNIRTDARAERIETDTSAKRFSFVFFINHKPFLMPYIMGKKMYYRQNPFLQNELKPANYKFSD